MTFTAFTVDLPKYIADFESCAENEVPREEEAKREAQMAAGFGAAHFMQFRSICERTDDPTERKELLEGLAEIVTLEVKHLVSSLLLAYP